MLEKTVYYSREMGRSSNVLLLFSATLLTRAFSANFSDLFQPCWAPDHIIAQADTLQLKLDNASGCGFESKHKYLFGRASVEIKLVEGDSAGTVTAFYMSSEGPYHDELDFEFLGNVSGEPYLVQTNVYVNGSGNREQRHTLWFDPTADFHAYSLLWNRHRIMFLIDGIPIRIFSNKEDVGVPYARNKGMGIYGSIWNADDWATQGGRVKTDWTHAPFISTFRSFEVDLCEYVPERDDLVGKCKEGSNYWWDRPAMDGLSLHQTHQLRWVSRKHMVYDYCKDKARFSDSLKECLS